MKKLFGLLLNPLFLGVLLIGMESCKKDNETPVPNPNPGGGTEEKISFTLNGDGFNNQAYAINSSSTSVVALGSYSPTQNYTGLSIAGNNSATKSITTVIAFKGSQTGNFALGANENEDQAHLILQIKDGGVEKQYVSTENAGTLKITKYENVGGKIEGSFSGTLTRFDLSTGTPSTVTVSNFKFTAARIANSQ
jgi:hypothetical protein